MNDRDRELLENFLDQKLDDDQIILEKLRFISTLEPRVKDYLGFEFDAEFMLNFLEVEELLTFGDGASIEMNYKPLKK